MSEADKRLGCMQAIQGLLDALPTHELANVQSYLDTKVSRMGLAVAKQVELGADGKPIAYKSI